TRRGAPEPNYELVRAGAFPAPWARASGTRSAQGEVPDLVAPLVVRAALDDEGEIVDRCADRHRLRPRDDPGHWPPRLDPVERPIDHRGDIVCQENAVLRGCLAEHRFVIGSAET